MAEVEQPRLLILETSGRVGQVALAHGDALLAIRPLDEARRHARDLTPAVQNLLTAQNWKAQTLDGVIVSRGPGSYTGLRVGIISAKTLAYATGCAFLAIDTFAAIARQAPAEALRLDVVADAQQDKLYVESFEREPGDQLFRSRTALAIRPFAEWTASLAAPTWVSGPGLRGHASRLPPGVRLVDMILWDPQPESLLRLGLARYRNGERDDLWTAEPLYLRPSSAEEQWSAKKAP